MDVLLSIYQLRLYNLRLKINMLLMHVDWNIILRMITLLCRWNRWMLLVSLLQWITKDTKTALDEMKFDDSNDPQIPISHYYIDTNTK